MFDEQPFADFINTVPKYVVTSSPLTTDWAPAEAVSTSGGSLWLRYRLRATG